MTDQNPDTNQQPTFDLRRVFLKDASVEIPNAPQIFLEQSEPNVNIEIANKVNNLDNGIFEVVVGATITATHGDKSFFLVEAKQSGIFELHNIPSEQMSSILNVACPAMIYPYLRANITDLLTRATLPPLYLQEVNFEQLYQAQLEQTNATKQ